MKEMRKVLSGAVQELQRFTDFLCNVMGRYANVAITIKDLSSPEIFTIAGWAGNVPADIQSKAPFVALEKLAELLRVEAPPNILSMTPINNDPFSRGWMGAVGKGGVYVEVSKWAQEIDRLLALILIYHQVEEHLKLHHVGKRFSDRTLFEAEQKPLGDEDRLVYPEDDHERVYYTRVYRGRRYYRECQFFTEPDSYDNAIHLDFQTENPMKFLEFIANAYGMEPTALLTRDQNDPCGMVWISGKDDVLGVMARKVWWRVEG